MTEFAKVPVERIKCLTHYERFTEVELSLGIDFKALFANSMGIEIARKLVEFNKYETRDLGNGLTVYKSAIEVIVPHGVFYGK